MREYKNGNNNNNFTEYSPRETNSSLAGQKIYCNVGNPKDYYRAHESQPLVLILSQINPAHALPAYSFTIRFNPLIFIFQAASFPQVSPPKPNLSSLFSPVRATTTSIMFLWIWAPT